MELEEYRESRYLPANRFARLYDSKIAKVFEDDQGRIYYEYSQNEVKLKNLACSDPSLHKNVVCAPSEIFVPQTRLHAYDYKLHDGRKFIYESGKVNSVVPADCGFGNYIYANELAYCYQTKNRRCRSSTRSKYKLNDRKERKNLPLHDNSNLWLANPPLDNGLSQSNKSNNIAGPIYECGDYDARNYCDQNNSFTALPAKVTHRTDLNQGLWLQPKWISRDSFRSPQPLSPSSPLDSGLSSQSVASTPSLEAEPMIPRKIRHCGSPLPHTFVPRNQCSCSTNSYLEPELTSPQTRNDSGRSSPWVHSTVQKCYDMEEPAKSPGFGCGVFPPMDRAHDVDQRRYSMSGLYVSPREKYFHGDALVSNGKKSEIQNPSKGCNRQDLYGYEYIDENVIRTFAPQLNSSLSQTCQTEPKHLENDVRIAEDGHKENVEELSELCDESNESYVRLAASNSSTEHNSLANKEDTASFKKRSSNSEKAICELEELYNKLNLQDHDLLDRAERRDLPTAHQIHKPFNLTRSKSDSYFEIVGPNYCNTYKTPQRAPPSRRSGVPDLIADDMAIRKLQKGTYKTQARTDPTPSYMLYSSHFTPPIPVSNTGCFLTEKRPDIEYDDFSFRRYFHLNSGKAECPQPPFGIPLHPSHPQSIFSDYMHVVPSCIPPPLCHPRGNPDLVRDDLAFRSLRKDNPERAMHDSYSLSYRKVR